MWYFHMYGIQKQFLEKKLRIICYKIYDGKFENVSVFIYRCAQKW